MSEIKKEHQVLFEKLRENLSQAEVADSTAMNTVLKTVDELETLVIQMRQDQADFVSTVIHELRLPMTSILGYSDLLKQGAMGELNEMQLNFVSVIRKNGNRMSSLVSSLSDISKVEHDRTILEPEMIDIYEMVKSVVERKQPGLKEKSQIFQVQIPTDLPYVEADLSRVKQILDMFIENASLYSGAGSAILIAARQEGSNVKFAVRDQGLGISEAEQVFIFDQFFRSEQQEVRDAHGWGLGLTVAKGLIGLMKGEIGVISQPNQGSTFWFTLPIGGNSVGN